jgi:hypothetical protein
MRKAHREAVRVLQDLGYKVLDSYQSKHCTLLVRAPSGCEFRMQLSTGLTSNPRGIKNMVREARLIERKLTGVIA